MAVSLSVVAAKDSAGTAIAGGLQAQDKSGAGTGPFTLGHVMIDGLAGTNMAAVTAANAVKVDGSAVTQPVSIATAPVLVAGAAIIGKVGIDQTTDGTTNAVHLVAGTAIAGKVGIDQTTDGTTNKVAADVRLGGVAASTGSGVMGTGTQRVAMATDSPGVIAVGTAGSPSVNVVTMQGVASMTPVLVTPGVSATANGATTSRINSAASNNLTNLKASAGQLYTIDVFNVAAYNVFLKIYNKASAPVVASDTPVMTIPIQAGGGYSKTWPMGLPFATGIAYAIVKLQADTDNTNVVAGDLTGNIVWI